MARRHSSLIYAALLWLSIFVVDALTGCAAPRSTVMEFTDISAPVIRGVEDKVVSRGSRVDYMTGVETWDDQDADPVLLVDSSRVRTDIPGTYDASYTATDASGNQRTRVITVTVVDGR